MIIYPKTGTITASGGSAAVTIPVLDGICRQVFVKAATATTTFDVKLTDKFSLDVLEDADITGLYNQLMTLPCYGNWTLTISNASVNEAFTYLIVNQEN